MSLDETKLLILFQLRLDVPNFLALLEPNRTRQNQNPGHLTKARFCLQ